MGVQKTSTSEESFVRAYTDAQAELEHEYPVMVECHVSPTSQKGVLNFRWEVYVLPGGLEPPMPLCWYAKTYPNAQAGAMGAHLFSCMIKLCQLVDSAWLDYKAARKV
jgi:hypothetical protein